MADVWKGLPKGLRLATRTLFPDLKAAALAVRERDPADREWHITRCLKGDIAPLAFSGADGALCSIRGTEKDYRKRIRQGKLETEEASHRKSV